MIETLHCGTRKARKEHICDFCSEFIHRGENYIHSTDKYEGRLYDWKIHEKCDFLSSQLWEYADPDEGMDEELFKESLRDFCRVFICPDCEHWDNEYEDCNDDKSYCIDKAYDFLQTHELYLDRRIGFCYEWKCRLREGGIINERNV